jgi:O-antigen ligase
MRVILPGKPFHRSGFSTLWVSGTGQPAPQAQQACAVGLFVLAAAATATISMRDPFPGWGYALGVFLLAGYWALREILTASGIPSTCVGVALALISLWGLAQLAAGATVYRYATWDASVRSAAMGATAFTASRALSDGRLRLQFLQAFAWFGFAVSVVSVLAYFTSPGHVLWVFPSPYPDVWGPFLSRNDFAGFLELAFPVAMWLALDRSKSEHRPAMLLWAPAWMLAAGLASASRAGAVLLILEAAVFLVRFPRRRETLRFAVATIVLVCVAGIGTLLGRLSDPDPLRYRREIAASTLKMIADHPWHGFGLGTYAQVYPAYATFDSGAAVEHAHDEWLEWAAEGGIPLAAVWAVLAVGIAGPALRSLWGLGVVAALLHATVDYPFARFGLTAWTFALIGAIGSAEVREVTERIH